MSEVGLSRVAKFRVWTGSKMEHNVMAGYLGAFYVPGLDPKDAASMSPFNTSYSDLAPLMEFVGIKDKSGTEVYEGDWLRVAIKGGWVTEGEVRRFIEYGLIGVARNRKWKYLSANRDEPLGSSGSSTAFKPYLWNSYRTIEVIGNIYQNPELLNQGSAK